MKNVEEINLGLRDAIRSARERKRLSLPRLAQLLGVSTKRLRAIEAYPVRTPVNELAGVIAYLGLVEEFYRVCYDIGAEL